MYKLPQHWSRICLMATLWATFCLLAACSADPANGLGGKWAVSLEEMRKIAPYKDNPAAAAALPALGAMTLEIDMEAKTMRSNVLGQQVAGRFEIRKQEGNRFVLHENGLDLKLTLIDDDTMEFVTMGQVVIFRRVR